MNKILCPHCGAATSAGAYCESCGMALPSKMASGPRIVGGSTLAATAVGQDLQSEELQKQAKRARGALLAVAILQTIGLLLVFGLSRMVQGRLEVDEDELMFIMVAQVIVSIVFWGLYFWARRQPLPAAIVGLVLYATLVLINMVTAVGEAAQGQRRGIGGSGIGCLDIVIMAVLAQAITAGVQHRKLIKQRGFPMKQQGFPLD